MMILISATCSGAILQGEDGMLNGCHVGNEMDTRVMEWRTCNTSRANCPGMADVLAVSGGLIKRCHGGGDIMQGMSER